MNGIEFEVYKRYISDIIPTQSKLLIIDDIDKNELELLRSHGYEAFAIDNNETRVNHRLKETPSIRPRLKLVKYPSIENAFNFKFDGVILGNVFSFLKRDEALQIIREIKSILTDNGRVILSLPQPKHRLLEESNDQAEPYVYHPDQVQILMERLGFQIISQWINFETEDKHSSYWVTSAFTLLAKSVIRPADQIEGVLNADEKTATYKLALIRALSELAVNNFSQVKWLEGGQVAIPLDAIVEKWLFYYWPIVASRDFIPQMEGEKHGGNRSIHFRPHLQSLIDYYSKLGGFSVFIRDLQMSSFSADGLKLLNATRRAIETAIKKGPVVHAGARQVSGRLFSADKSFLICPFTLWREFSLLGHWIMDASIVRWAKETLRFSKMNFEGKIMDLLLTTPVTERDADYASGFYKKIENLECVWTGSRLNHHYDIDHIIPFALWRNNDLWNLVPARRDINMKKRDRLPTMTILRQRKDAIMGCWESLMKDSPKRFSLEASRLVGMKNLPEANWQTLLYSAMVESIEITALQRAVPRWEP